MTVFFSQLINGLSLGSIYALVALGGIWCISLLFREPSARQIQDH